MSDKQNQIDNIQRKAFLWNTCGGMLNAFQSVIILMVLTRTLGLYDAGVFTIAYASANLFLTIGKYGIRPFQATDINEQYNFKEYRWARYISSLAMFLVTIGYIVYVVSVQEYSFDKAAVIFFMCILKLIDAVEDVYIGRYQQKGRLDIGAKVMTIRISITILVFIAGLFVIRNLLTTLILTVVISTLLCVVMIMKTYGEFRGENSKIKPINIRNLSWECFPLCISNFLSFYIGNAPKYAIDAQLGEEVQACYGFISMPVFVIGLLSTFIFQPILTKMAMEWSDRKVRRFVKRVFQQCGYIVVITFAALVGGYLLGIPVLSILYNTDLSDYKANMLELLAGGGVLALASFMVIVLTIMRDQKSIILGYGVAAILAAALSPISVQRFAIDGACYLYLALMLITTLIFTLIVILKIHQAAKK